MKIVDKQIINQIEGRVEILLFTPDFQNRFEFISLYDQNDNKFIGNFGRYKELPSSLYHDLVSQFTGESVFSLDCVDRLMKDELALFQIIRSSFLFDDFFDRYFNHLESVNFDIIFRL